MYKYDGSEYRELKFASIEAHAEERDGQWIDVYFKFTPANPAHMPTELQLPSGWLICTIYGQPVQYVVLDDGCDTEYQFTEDEKQQIMSDIERTRLLERWLLDETAQ